MTEVRFRLNIDEADYLRFYQGVAQVVVVRAFDGRRVQFPAANLRRFVAADGIHGEFRLRFDGRNKLVALERVGG